ncbi:MAG: hypothetical protein INR69_07045 [Mucilaginibacter polytrichastri]|nr:hypothetical protein [Mucilaginibacter polytrichastri]
MKFLFKVSFIVLGLSLTFLSACEKATSVEPANIDKINAVNSNYTVEDSLDFKMTRVTAVIFAMLPDLLYKVQYTFNSGMHYRYGTGNPTEIIDPVLMYPKYLSGGGSRCDSRIEGDSTGITWIVNPCDKPEQFTSGVFRAEGWRYPEGTIELKNYRMFGLVMNGKIFFEDITWEDYKGRPKQRVRFVLETVWRGKFKRTFTTDEMTIDQVGGWATPLPGEGADDEWLIDFRNLKTDQDEEISGLVYSSYNCNFPYKGGQSMRFRNRPENQSYPFTQAIWGGEQCDDQVTIIRVNDPSEVITLTTY